MGTDILIYLGGLALLDTLSPTIIGVTLYLILTDNENLITRLSSYLITVMILYFSLGIIMILGLDYITDAFSNVFQNRRVLFIIGAILFVGSYFIPINKKNNIPKPKTQGIFSIIIIGIVTFFIEAGIALPYLAAIGMLSTTNIPFYNKLSIIAAYNFIMILPALFILLGYKLCGIRINSRLVNLRNKISANTNTALSWIICIVGVILMLYSIDGLTIRIK
ncbi:MULTISPECIES: GAP family protein [unclassified Bacillus (in: firmicutes)]|uniref:GAP family protein n=1 Tax=unclassified Bacillus (in: firmicutes) TaxID=185979 RepID=UPI0008E4AF8E|nr:MULTISPECIES: GAP family protein [unclassified Bacillus (in: firmicutes)]SFK12384.1 Sap, sulfolipid-1-addressing protein [Bacillus sp. 71mf]SFT23980.1 Sap, sulfolipid-1-addressing protein [Bacillus sp. 103mf]